MPVDHEIPWRGTRHDWVIGSHLWLSPPLRRQELGHDDPEFLLHLGGSPVYVVVRDAHGEPAGAVSQDPPGPAQQLLTDAVGEERGCRFEGPQAA